MFPRLNLDNAIEELENSEHKNQGVTFLYDFDKGDFVIKDGRLVEVEGEEAIKVWIEKILRTEKFKSEIYKDTDYGVTIKELVYGKKLPQFFIQSELKRQVEEALKKHSAIDRIENFKTEQNMATLKIYFSVVLKDENTFIQEVVF